MAFLQASPLARLLPTDLLATGVSTLGVLPVAGCGTGPIRASGTMSVGQLEERKGELRSPRGHRLYTLTLLPTGSCQVLIVYHHGFGEHCDR